MTGHVFIAPGDITRLGADAIAYSASNVLTRDGNLASSFEAAFPGFVDWLGKLRAAETLPRRHRSDVLAPARRDTAAARHRSRRLDGARPGAGQGRSRRARCHRPGR